jgi:uroporphyrinogen decarboxylase
LEEQNIAVISRTDEKVITRDFTENNGKRIWSKYATVYFLNEPSAFVTAISLGLPNEHDDYEHVKPNYYKTGKDYYRDAVEYVGAKGLVLPIICLPCLTHDPLTMYEYYDNKQAVIDRIAEQGRAMMRQVEEIISWQPEALMIGNSGLMLFNPPRIFRELSLDWMKRLTRLAKRHNVMTHMHCCGPERALVKIAANETQLDGIEPLEVSPMGDCELKEIKASFGEKLALKGNLHTTDVMLFGSVKDVEDACKKAIDDAAAGGGFILSTGDQTPRDVPDENIFAMKHIAEKYGHY